VLANVVDRDEMYIVEPSVNIYTSLFRHEDSENKPNNKTRMTKTTTQKNNSNSDNS